MKDLKITQKELNTLERAYQLLADYQSAFEDGDQSAEEWNTLQATMMELYVIKNKLQK